MPSSFPPTATSRRFVPAGDTPGHHVQFYDDDTCLVATVADFLGGGLTNRQPLVVIATRAHRASLVARLMSQGFDIGATAESGQLAICDARATMDTFMAGRVPDATLFKSTIGGAIAARWATRTDRPVVRLYGEMVDLLWKDGNPDGAIRLEELWNEIADDYAFSLLCAYAAGNFHETDDADLRQKICHLHMHIVPAEKAGRCAAVDFALAPLIAESLAMLDPVIVASRLTCEFTAAGPSPVPITARGDRETARQIVASLLTNAIKLTPAGGHIRVELATGHGPGDTVTIRVPDAGKSIPATQLDRIFDPFVQVGSSSSYRHGALGPGLCLSRDLARGMGGDLTVASTPTDGTAFTLTLPSA